MESELSPLQCRVRPLEKKIHNLPIASLLLTDRLIRILAHLNQMTEKAVSRNEVQYRSSRQCHRIEQKKLTPQSFGGKSPWQHISIQRCTADWQELWPSVRLELGHLRILWFNYCSLTSRDVVPLMAYLVNLFELCLGQNRICDEGAIAISQHLKKLRTLNMNVNRMSDSGAVAIVLDLPELQNFQCASNYLTRNCKLLVNCLNLRLKTNL